MQHRAPQVHITLAVTELKTYIRGKASESPECIGETRPNKEAKHETKGDNLYSHSTKYCVNENQEDYAREFKGRGSHCKSVNQLSADCTKDSVSSITAS